VLEKGGRGLNRGEKDLRREEREGKGSLSTSRGEEIKIAKMVCSTADSGR